MPEEPQTFDIVLALGHAVRAALNTFECGNCKQPIGGEVKGTVIVTVDGPRYLMGFFCEQCAKKLGIEYTRQICPELN